MLIRNIFTTWWNSHLSSKCENQFKDLLTKKKLGWIFQYIHLTFETYIHKKKPLSQKHQDFKILSRVNSIMYESQNVHQNDLLNTSKARSMNFKLCLFFKINTQQFPHWFPQGFPLVRKCIYNNPLHIYMNCFPERIHKSKYLTLIENL